VIGNNPGRLRHSHLPVLNHQKSYLSIILQQKIPQIIYRFNFLNWQNVEILKSALTENL